MRKRHSIRKANKTVIKTQTHRLYNKKSPKFKKHGHRGRDGL